MTKTKLTLIICIVLFAGLFLVNKKQADSFLASSDTYKQMSVVSDALAMMTSIKHYMAEFYLMNGKYPHDNLELGIDPPDKFATAQIQDLKVTQAGEIIVHFKVSDKQKKQAKGRGDPYDPSNC